MRVLGTDYGSSWVRELTWALVRVVNCSRRQRRRRIRTETLRSESLGSSSVYSKVCRTRIIGLDTSGLGFRAIAFGGDLAQAAVGDSAGAVGDSTGAV